MTITNHHHTTYSWSSWKEYSSFELHWLETILTKHVLSDGEINMLATRYGIVFPKSVQKKITSREMGNAIMNDVERKKLLPVVKSLIARQHQDLLTFHEAQKLYAVFSAMPTKMLIRACAAILKDTSLSHSLKRDLIEKPIYRKEDILAIALGGFYNARERE